MTIATMKHIRRAELCSDGARRWFKANNLNWQDFLDNGIDASILEATGDVQAIQVAKLAREDADGRL